MEAAVATSEVFQETTVFLSYFKELPDRRQAGKVVYRIDEILLLCLLAVLAGADGFTDIARFGVAKRDLLRRFRPYAEGTPCHDQIGDFFAGLDPHPFQRCFAAWVAAVTGVPQGVVAIDGKTVRRSYRKTGKSDPIPIVSAFAARQRLVLAQTKVDDKSNEIVAIPALLDLLAIEGAIVTIDAKSHQDRGCQRAIAQKIIDKKADDVLALKGNQGTLRDDVELFVAEQKANGFQDCKIDRDHTVDGDHGRIEERTTTVVYDVDWLRRQHDWPNLNCLVIVDSVRRLGDKIETETRFYIASVILLAAQMGAVVRAHWTIENCLHWVLDVTFRDDDCRVRTDHAATTFLGRQITPQLAQELGSQFTTRIEGTCLEHRFGKASIKMYDKFGCVLRIETTTNDVSFFKHHRKVDHRDGPPTRALAPVKKSIYSLIDLREILLGCNRRYLAHLSALDDFSAGMRALDRLTKPHTLGDKTVKGINFFEAGDRALLRALQNPKVNIAGIRRGELLPDLGMFSPTRLSRHLRRLLDLGVIKRVTNSYRYYLTKAGRAATAAAHRLTGAIIVPPMS